MEPNEAAGNWASVTIFANPVCSPSLVGGDLSQSHTDTCLDGATHASLVTERLLDSKDRFPVRGWAASPTEPLPWASSLAAALTCT